MIELGIKNRTEEILVEIKEIGRRNSINITQFATKDGSYIIDANLKPDEKSILTLLNILNQLSTLFKTISQQLKKPTDTIGIKALTKLLPQAMGLNSYFKAYTESHATGVSILQYELLCTFWLYLHDVGNDQQFLSKMPSIPTLIAKTNKALAKLADPKKLLEDIQSQVIHSINWFNDHKIGIDRQETYFLNAYHTFKDAFNEYTQTIDKLLTKRDVKLAEVNDTQAILNHLQELIAECEQVIDELDQHKNSLERLEAPHSLFKLDDNGQPVVSQIKLPLAELLQEKVAHAEQAKQETLLLQEKHQSQLEKEQLEALNQTLLPSDEVVGNNLDDQGELDNLRQAQDQIHNKIAAIQKLIAEVDEVRLADSDVTNKQNEVVKLQQEFNANAELITKQKEKNEKLCKKYTTNITKLEALKKAFDSAEGHEVPFNDLISAYGWAVRSLKIVDVAEDATQLNNIMVLLGIKNTERGYWEDLYQKQQAQYEDQYKGVLSMASSALWSTLGYSQTDTEDKVALGNKINDRLICEQDKKTKLSDVAAIKALENINTQKQNQINAINKDLQKNSELLDKYKNYEQALNKIKQNEIEVQNKIEEVEQRIKQAELQRLQELEKLKAKQQEAHEKQKASSSATPLPPRTPIRRRRNSAPVISNMKKPLNNGKRKIENLKKELDAYLSHRKKEFKLKDLIRSAIAFFTAGAYEPDQKKREHFIQEVVPLAVKDFKKTGNTAKLKGAIAQGRFFKPRTTTKKRQEYEKSLSYILDKFEQAVKECETEVKHQSPQRKV